MVSRGLASLSYTVIIFPLASGIVYFNVDNNNAEYFLQYKCDLDDLYFRRSR